jgi:hypothetical protein
VRTLPSKDTLLMSTQDVLIIGRKTFVFFLRVHGFFENKSTRSQSDVIHLTVLSSSQHVPPSSRDDALLFRWTHGIFKGRVSYRYSRLLYCTVRAQVSWSKFRKSILIFLPTNARLVGTNQTDVK